MNEPKDSTGMSDKCKLCTEPLPVKALHFSNELAIKHGYCSWICLSMDLGHERALAILNGEDQKKKRHE